MVFSTFQISPAVLLQPKREINEDIFNFCLLCPVVKNTLELKYILCYTNASDENDVGCVERMKDVMSSVLQARFVIWIFSYKILVFGLNCRVWSLWLFFHHPHVCWVFKYSELEPFGPTSPIYIFPSHYWNWTRNLIINWNVVFVAQLAQPTASQRLELKTNIGNPGLCC